MTIDKGIHTNKTPEPLGGFVALEDKCKAGKCKSRLPELLAPAGSPRALRAAINAGADAVYFALPDFNARINADNFTAETFTEGVRLCHEHGVKAYITLNTQVYDRERRDFLKSALFAYRAGADAAIVGDLGAAALIKKHIPDFELHASTQLSGHNSSAASELQRLGFTRMVCARELSLDDIRTFVATSPLEAEIFVHGALCVCHSGQCLFSSLVGGRSGNRGLCAQPCRLPYKTAKGDAYPLSLKDMCLASHITEIIESGVSSLKIEGRMKPAEYVYGVVSIYRRLLDERRNATKDELCELRDIFSRGGFTDGYFTKRTDKNMLGVRSEKDKESSRAVTCDVEKKQRRISIDICAELKKDQPMRLSLSIPERGIRAEVEGIVPEAAQNRPTDLDAAKKNLIKFGATPFEVRRCEIDLDEGLMIPVSELNNLRRKGAEKLIQSLMPPYYSRADHTLDIDAALSAKREAVKPRKERSTSFKSLSQIPECDAEYFGKIFLSMTEFCPENESEISRKNVNGIELAPVIFDSEAASARRCLETAKRLGVKYALVGNLGHLALAREYGFIPVGDFRLNVSSVETASLICDSFGFESVMLSPELTLPRVRDIARYVPSRLIVYGRIPLMIVEKCVLSELYPCGYAAGGAPCKACKTGTGKLTDRTGAAFPVLREFEHRNVIYNSLPTYMADKADTLPETASHFIFTTESADEVKIIINAYKTSAPAAFNVRRIGAVERN